MIGGPVRAHLRNGEPGLARAAGLELLRDAPEPERAILGALLARALVRTGEPAEALRRAWGAWERDGGWETALALGEARLATGDLAGATATLDLADALRASVDADGAGPPPSNARMTVAVARAEAARACGDWSRGMDIARDVAGDRRRVDPLDDADRLAVLGSCAVLAGEHETARDALESALAIYKVHPGSCDVAATLDWLGRLARHRDQAKRAVDLHRAALERWLEQLGPRAAPVAGCRHALAQALHRTGEFPGALAEMAIAADLTARCFGESHADTWISRFELGRFEMDTGRQFEGLARMESAHREVVALLGPGHPVVASMTRWL